MLAPWLSLLFAPKFEISKQSQSRHAMKNGSVLTIDDSLVGMDDGLAGASAVLHHHLDDYALHIFYFPRN